MGENAKRIHYTDAGAHGTGEGDRERVTEWEEGLPSIEDMTPLSQALISAQLMSAFSIPREPYRTSVEVNQAAEDTLSSLRRGNSAVFSSNNFESYKDGKNRDLLIIEEDDETNADLDDFESRKVRRINSPEETDSGMRMENSIDDHSNRTLKRPRLVWTPQLHKRFVEVVAILGVANAVPKTIMQMMNVEGLTRENVASHLQKYRLYLKRMQGLSNEGPSSSDPVFGSMPVPQSSHETSVGSGHGHVQMPIPPLIPPMIPPMIPPYPPHMMQMPVLGQGHMRMPYGYPNMGNYHGFESHPFSNMMQQRDWSRNSFSSYPPVAPNEN